MQDSIKPRIKYGVTYKGRVIFVRRLFLICLLLVFVGCAMPDEIELLPPMVEEPREQAFWLVPVERGDISYDASVPAIAVVPTITNQNFSLTGAPILEIFVQVGSTVHEGEIIASLDVPQVQGQFDQISSRQAAISFEIGLLNDRRQLAVNFSRPTAGYDAMLASLNTEFTLNAELLAHVTELNEQRYLRASKDGIISAINFDEGQMPGLSNFAGIANIAFPYFVVQGDAAADMLEGERFQMVVGSTIFAAEVVEPDTFGLPRSEDAENEAFLLFADVTEFPRITGATNARVLLHTEIREGVLFIPNSLLHNFEERTFVFIVEDGFRTMRDVVTGFVGGGFTEIVSGLEEGELVLQ